MAPWVVVLSIHALHPGAAIALSKIPARSICIYILINSYNEISFYERVVLGVGRHILRVCREFHKNFTLTSTEPGNVIAGGHNIFM
jgi:hypothetical protein